MRMVASADGGGGGSRGRGRPDLNGRSRGARFRRAGLASLFAKRTRQSWTSGLLKARRLAKERNARSASGPRCTAHPSTCSPSTSANSESPGWTLTLNFFSARSRISDPPSNSLTSIIRDPESRKWNLRVFLLKSSEPVEEALCPRCGKGPRPTLYPELGPDEAAVEAFGKFSWTGVRTLWATILMPAFVAYGWAVVGPPAPRRPGVPNELCFWWAITGERTPRGFGGAVRAA